jgi:hypothetical protein
MRRPPNNGGVVRAIRHLQHRAGPGLACRHQHNGTDGLGTARPARRDTAGMPGWRLGEKGRVSFAASLSPPPASLVASRAGSLGLRSPAPGPIGELRSASPAETHYQHGFLHPTPHAAVFYLPPQQILRKLDLRSGHRRSGGRAPPRIGSSALRRCAFRSVLYVTLSEKKHHKRGGGLVSLTGAPWQGGPRLGTADPAEEPSALAAALCGAARKQDLFWM